MDRDERRQFVKDHRTCIFGYARKNAGPAMTVVYCLTDGDEILISSMEERAKVKAVERNPHVSICVLDEKWPPTYLQVFGEAMIDRDPDVVFDVAVRGVELMSGSKVPEELHKPSEREFAAKTGSLSGCAPPRLSIHRRDTPTRQKTCAD